MSRPMSEYLFVAVALLTGRMLLAGRVGGKGLGGRGDVGIFERLDVSLLGVA